MNQDDTIRELRNRIATLEEEILQYREDMEQVDGVLFNILSRQQLALRGGVGEAAAQGLAGVAGGVLDEVLPLGALRRVLRG